MSDKELIDKVDDLIVVACSVLHHDSDIIEGNEPEQVYMRDQLRKGFIKALKENAERPNFYDMQKATRAAERKRCIDAVKKVCYKNGWAAEDELLETLQDEFTDK